MSDDSDDGVQTNYADFVPPREEPDQNRALSDRALEVRRLYISALLRAVRRIENGERLNGDDNSHESSDEEEETDEEESEYMDDEEIFDDYEPESDENIDQGEEDEERVDGEQNSEEVKIMSYSIDDDDNHVS